MTKAAPESAESGSEGMRRVIKRAGHELRNAQNAAAVNLEVVRSRVAAGKTEKEALQSFADSAAKGLEESARLGEAFVALTSAAVSALAGNVFKETVSSSNEIALELGMSAQQAEALVQRVGQLAERAGFTAEAGPTGVILRIPPDNDRNRA